MLASSDVATLKDSSSLLPSLLSFVRTRISLLVERLGIIALDTSSSFSDKSVYAPFEETDYYKTFSSKAIRSYASKRATIHKYLGFFTPLGKNFFEVCVK